MKIRKKGVVNLLIIINYIFLTGCFGFYETSEILLFNIKVVDLLIMLTILVALLFSFYGGKIVVKKNIFIGLWIGFLIFSIVRGAAVFNLSQEYMFRNVRTYFYLVPYFLVTSYFYAEDNKGALDELMLLILKLETIHGLIYVVNFVTGMVGVPMLPTTNVMEIAGMTVARNYHLPLLLIFDLLLIINVNYMKAYTKLYRWVSRRKMVLLGIIGGTILLTFTRGVYITSLLALTLNLLFVTKKDLSFIRKVIVIVTVVVLIIMSPIGTTFLEYTLSDVSETEKLNNFSLRLFLFEERYEYLEMTDNVLFGIGPRMDSDPNQNIRFTYGHETQKGIYTGDMGYTTVVLQFGVFGMGLYMAIFFKAFLVWSKTAVSKIIKIQVLVAVILFFESANLISYPNLFFLSTVLGVLDRVKGRTQGRHRGTVLWGDRGTVLWRHRGRHRGTVLLCSLLQSTQGHRNLREHKRTVPLCPRKGKERKKWEYYIW